MRNWQWGDVRGRTGILWWKRLLATRHGEGAGVGRGAQVRPLLGEVGEVGERRRAPKEKGREEKNKQRASQQPTARHQPASERARSPRSSLTCQSSSHVTCLTLSAWRAKLRRRRRILYGSTANHTHDTHDNHMLRHRRRRRRLLACAAPAIQFRCNAGAIPTRLVGGASSTGALRADQRRRRRRRR